jgi:hypothetical protein
MPDLVRRVCAEIPSGSPSVRVSLVRADAAAEVEAQCRTLSERLPELEARLGDMGQRLARLEAGEP